MPGIESVRELGDPQLTFNFEVIFPIIGSIDVSSYVESIGDIPFKSLEVNNVVHGASDEKFAGKFTIPDFSAVFYQAEKNNIFKYYELWNKMIINQDDTYNYPEDYKRNIRVNLLAGDGVTITNAWRLIGCFPISAGGISPTSDSSDRLRPTLGFSVDKVEYVE